ncbi:hypothetical protein H9P43_003681 [Blastocladiella emersonii ATCC 22665]|nr:hypothetical protein H9P43_003681 [Blastocladiella emersonii ATCC 22665]
MADTSQSQPAAQMAAPKKHKPVRASADHDDGGGDDGALSSISDFGLPASQISRIFKDAAGASKMSLARDAREAMNQSTVTFVNYITALAHEVATKAKKKTINANDVLAAVEAAEMADMLPTLRIALEQYQAQKSQKKSSSSSARQPAAPTAAAPAAPAAVVVAAPPPPPPPVAVANEEEDDEEIDIMETSDGTLANEHGGHGRDLTLATAKAAMATASPAAAALDSAIGGSPTTATATTTLTLSEEQSTAITESVAQHALRQPEILRILLRYVAVATGALREATLVDSAWHAAVIRHINALLPLPSPASLAVTATRGVARRVPPAAFATHCVTRTYVAATIRAHPRGLPRLLRVFHYIDAWRSSEPRLRDLMLVVASQPQPRHPRKHGAPAKAAADPVLPLVLDTFLHACPRSANMGFVWATMETVLERDAHAVLTHLSALALRAHPAAVAAGVAPQPNSAQEVREAAVLAALRDETTALEGEGGAKFKDHTAIIRHRLTVVDRHLLLNVYAWCTRWIALLQHAPPATGSAAPKTVAAATAEPTAAAPATPTSPPTTIATALSAAKPFPAILSGDAIDATLAHLFCGLDAARRRAWESLLRQILRCTNKWLSIVCTISRVMDTVTEHAQLVVEVQQQAGVAGVAAPGENAGAAPPSVVAQQQQPAPQQQVEEVAADGPADATDTPAAGAPIEE